MPSPPVKSRVTSTRRLSARVPRVDPRIDHRHRDARARQRRQVVRCRPRPDRRRCSPPSRRPTTAAGRRPTDGPTSSSCAQRRQLTGGDPQDGAALQIPLRPARCSAPRARPPPPFAVDDHVNRLGAGGEVVGEVGAQPRAVLRAAVGQAGSQRTGSRDAAAERQGMPARSVRLLWSWEAFIAADGFITVTSDGRGASSAAWLRSSAPSRAARAASRPASVWSAAGPRESGCRSSGAIRRAARRHGPAKRCGRYEARGLSPFWFMSCHVVLRMPEISARVVPEVLRRRVASDKSLRWWGCCVIGSAAAVRSRCRRVRPKT